MSLEFFYLFFKGGGVQSWDTAQYLRHRQPHQPTKLFMSRVFYTVTAFTGTKWWTREKKWDNEQMFWYKIIERERKRSFQVCSGYGGLSFDPHFIGLWWSAWGIQIFCCSAVEGINNAGYRESNTLLRAPRITPLCEMLGGPHISHMWEALDQHL